MNSVLSSDINIVLATNEIMLLKGLKFQLTVYSPIRPIYSIIYLLKEKYENKDKDKDKDKEKEKVPTDIVKKSAVLNMIFAFQIDHLIFVYTPGQIAAACVEKAI